MNHKGSGEIKIDARTGEIKSFTIAIPVPNKNFKYYGSLILRDVNGKDAIVYIVSDGTTSDYDETLPELLKIKTKGGIDLDLRGLNKIQVYYVKDDLSGNELTFLKDLKDDLKKNNPETFRWGKRPPNQSNTPTNRKPEDIGGGIGVPIIG